MATAKKSPAKPAKPTAPAKNKAAPKPPAAEKAPKPPKAPKVERPQSNGISQPKEGTTTGRIWSIADEISAKQKRPATRAEVLEKATAENINEATVATQYQRWRTFHGLEKQPRAKKDA